MIIIESKDEIYQYLIDQANFQGNCEKVFLVENRAEIEFVKFSKMAIGKTSEAKLDYVAFGHIGDSHLHLNLLPTNSGELERASMLKENLIQIIYWE
jgi:hypothetical protein